MSRARCILVSIGKGLLAGLVWQVGLIAGAIIAPLLGFEAPPSPPGVDPTLLLPLGVLIGAPVAILLGELNRRLRLPFVPRALVVFLEQLQALGFQVKRSFRLTNSISLRGTGKQALQLLDIPWVTRVEPDRPVHAYRR